MDKLFRLSKQYTMAMCSNMLYTHTTGVNRKEINFTQYLATEAWQTYSTRWSVMRVGKGRKVGGVGE